MDGDRPAPLYAVTPDALRARTGQALQIAMRSETTDGAHHKQWLIDQMVRALTGCTGEAESDWYNTFRCLASEWDEGTPP